MVRIVRVSGILWAEGEEMVVVIAGCSSGDIMVIRAIIGWKGRREQ